MPGSVPEGQTEGTAVICCPWLSLSLRAELGVPVAAEPPLLGPSPDFGQQRSGGARGAHGAHGAGMGRGKREKGREGGRSRTQPGLGVRAELSPGLVLDLLVFSKLEVSAAAPAAPGSGCSQVLDISVLWTSSVLQNSIRAGLWVWGGLE